MHWVEGRRSRVTGTGAPAVADLLRRDVAQILAILKDIGIFAVDRTDQTPVHSIGFGRTERILQHVAEGLHVRLALEVRPRPMRLSQYVRACFSAEIHLVHL